MEKKYSFLQAFFNSIPDAYVLLEAHDPKHTIIEANKAFANLFMLPSSAILNKSIFDFYPIIPGGENVADISKLNAAFDLCVSEKTITEAIINSYSIIPHHSDQIQKITWSVYNYPVLSGDDEVILIIHKAIEVKTAEVAEPGKEMNDFKFQNALLKARTQATPDGVLVVDGKGNIITFNKQFAEIWKIPKEILDLKDDNLALKHAMTRLVNPEEFIERVNYLYANPDKRSYDKFYFKDGRIIESHGLPIKDEDGTYYGWAWYLRDITERITQIIAVERVRQKVARDLHDDVGSTLTTIGLLSNVAKAKLNKNMNDARNLLMKINDETNEVLEKISQNSNQMMEALSDIVWSINPVNDNMNKIIIRMREYAVTLFEAKGIDFTFKTNEFAESINLDTEARLDFFLIFKEAVNNLVKYSLCQAAEIMINYSDNSIKMIISDNGIGFDPTTNRSGNGLINIYKRAKQINAILNIESTPEKGTKITLIVPVKEKE